jgi:SAM-dependent methyltransferase
MGPPTRPGWIAALARWYQTRQENIKRQRFVQAGCVPWTAGYTAYKRRILQDALNDADLLTRFAEQRDLPPKFGYRVDERIVEVPWVLARLKEESRVLLDAGASLNHDFLLEQATLQSRRVVICSVSRENRLGGSNVSRVCSDLRQTGFQDASFDEIVCISTLEHVGMDNTRVYFANARMKEHQPDDYLRAVKEFRRLLKPRGRLFLTVPYGRYEDHGWVQQFDRERLEAVPRVFDGKLGARAFYRYFADGWRRVDADACADCRYFDIQACKDHEPDYVAAARAVACMELLRSGD